MPELPEVETIKEDLLKHVVGSNGATITAAEILDERLVENLPVGEFVKRLRGAKVVGARRRAKYLILALGGGDSLVFQLKIGGQFLLVPPAEEPMTDLMLCLDLEDGRKIFLRDETTYTRAQVYSPEELEARFADLGPEPFDDEFTSSYLKEKVGGRRAQIKPLLLDQKTVSGIGNIYVDEALFCAGVHPRRKANSLSESEWSGLHEAILSNLREGVRDRGTTFSLYRDLLGREGRHQDHLRVFLRVGRECPNGNGKVEKITVGGRATFICATCQVEGGPEASGGETGDGFGGAEQLELL